MQNPSVNDLIRNDNKDKAFKEIAKIYILDKGLSEDEKSTKIEKLFYQIKSTLSEQKEDVSIKDALISKKYRRGTWNGVITCFLDQFTGITALMIYSTVIFKSMKDQGKYKLSVSLTLQLINISNWIGCFLVNIPGKFFSQKQILQGGLFIMLISQVLNIIFVTYEINYGTIVMMAVFLLAFQSSLGPIKFIHIVETSCDVAAGISQQALWASAVICSIITPLMATYWGALGMFVFYMAITLFFNIFVYISWKDSTHKTIDVLEDGKMVSKKIQLTDKERKDLYTPVEFRIKDTPDEI